MGDRSLPAPREVVDEAATGRLIVRTFPLSQAVAARRIVESGHVRGKVVLTV